MPIRSKAHADRVQQDLQTWQDQQTATAEPNRVDYDPPKPQSAGATRLPKGDGSRYARAGRARLY